MNSHIFTTSEKEDLKHLIAEREKAEKKAEDPRISEEERAQARTYANALTHRIDYTLKKAGY